jgi:hypothetical protein
MQVSPTNLSQALVRRVERVSAVIFRRDPYILACKTGLAYCGADVLFIFVHLQYQVIKREPAGDKNGKKTSSLAAASM